MKAFFLLLFLSIFAILLSFTTFFGISKSPTKGDRGQIGPIGDVGESGANGICICEECVNCTRYCKNMNEAVACTSDIFAASGIRQSNYLNSVKVPNVPTIEEIYTTGVRAQYVSVQYYTGAYNGYGLFVPRDVSRLFCGSDECININIPVNFQRL